MDWNIAVTLATLVVVIASLVLLRTGPDLILLSGVALLLLAGVVSPTEAFAGFGNEGLITVALLYVVAEGLRQTGAISFFSQQLLGKPRSIRSAQMRMMGPVAVASAFLNNTPVVAMLLPVINDWAKKHRISVSHLMLPLSYAAMLGGLCTLVGTSTTLVVNGLLIDSHGQSLTMFEIGAIGIPATLLGVGYVLLFSRWLLPQRKPAIALLDDPREYTVEMLVEPSSPLVGKTIEGAGLRHLTGMYLMEIDREGHVLAAVSSTERIKAHDRLVFVGIVESVVDLQRIPGVRPATDQVFKLDSPRAERCLVEAVVSDSCPLLRMTIREARFRSRYNAAVIAVARNGERIRKKIGDIRLLAGDTLLLEAHTSFIDLQRNSRDFFLVGEVADSAPPRHERAWIARILLVAMVLSVALGWLNMLKAALLTSILMIATRCCRSSEARKAIDLHVLLVIGAGLGIGKAMVTSGSAALLAERLIHTMGGHPYLLMTAIFGVTMVLTNLITNNAAAVLVFPIAMAAVENLSAQLGRPVDHMPFVIAVIVAASASFATPVSYQTNLMVFGPGGYRNSDYFRFGVPLTILLWVLTVVLVPLVWPYY